MRIRDWSSDVCSSDLGAAGRFHGGRVGDGPALAQRRIDHRPPDAVVARLPHDIVGILDDGEQAGGGLHLFLPAVRVRIGMARRQMTRQTFEKSALLHALVNAGRTALFPLGVWGLERKRPRLTPVTNA